MPLRPTLPFLCSLTEKQRARSHDLHFIHYACPRRDHWSTAPPLVQSPYAASLGTPACPQDRTRTVDCTRSVSIPRPHVTSSHASTVFDASALDAHPYHARPPACAAPAAPKQVVGRQTGRSGLEFSFSRATSNYPRSKPPPATHHPHDAPHQRPVPQRRRRFSIAHAIFVSSPCAATIFRVVPLTCAPGHIPSMPYTTTGVPSRRDDRRSPSHTPIASLPRRPHRSIINGGYRSLTSSLRVPRPQGMSHPPLHRLYSSPHRTVSIPVTMSLGAHVLESPACIRLSAHVARLQQVLSPAHPTMVLPPRVAEHTCNCHPPHATSIQFTIRMLCARTRLRPRHPPTPPPRPRPLPTLRTTILQLDPCAPPHIYEHSAFRWPRIPSHPHTARVTYARLSSDSALTAQSCARDVRTRRAFHAVVSFSVVHIRIRGRASKLRPPAVSHSESR
ncbi:hypothetical protein B0H13DRAFT_2680302 [Mycena leptocephala]|nr:hypothetical protein B0H13DRAFT_2680302 [Mycena leptocephala]